MPEIRTDPILGHRVIIAKSRTDRPQEFADDVPRPRQRGVCPFCEGNEHETPHEIVALRRDGTRPNEPGWTARVVPNKYPALAGSGSATSAPEPGDSFYATAAGTGAHEVIVESAAHVTRTTQLSTQALAGILGLYRQRLADVRQDRGLVQAVIFKNVGAAAGATLEHLHSQLVALPFVLPGTAAALERSRASYEQHDRCVYCEMVRRERARAERIVVDTAQFVAFCPFAARGPFETWIMPTEHASHYESLAHDATQQLANALHRVLASIESVLDRPAYNYVVRTAPFDTPALRHYHWHIEVVPRTSRLAGFEWGSGCYINSVPPEEAAAAMRTIGTAPQET